MIIIKNLKTDPIEETDIRIHRGFPLGNPFSHLPKSKAEFHSPTREDSILSYQQWLKGEVLNGNPVICDAINQLVIKNLKKEDFGLVCYCRPKPCHGQIIKDFVKEQKYCINWFSNMKKLDAPFLYQGISYASTENFYQSMKLPKEDIANRKYIASLSPFESKKEIRNFETDPTFNDRKLQVMEYALRKKFAQGTSWHKKLMSTTGELVELNNWKDVFWGKCIFSGKGENHLGCLLMKIRDDS